MAHRKSPTKKKWRHDNEKSPRLQTPGIPIGTLGNSLKCFASEMCYDVVNMGLQVFAGYGYSREYPLEKLLRDARIYSIFEGTNQVQRQVIGKTLLG